MNNINNFKNFLKTSKIASRKMLNEDLNALKKQYFANMPLGYLLRFAQYSPDWNETMQHTTLTLDFPTAQRRDMFAAAIETTNANSNKYPIYDISSGNSKLVDFDDVTTKKLDNTASATLTVTFPEKQFGQLAKALKQKGIKFVPKRAGDKITFSGSDLDLKNIFIVWSVLTAGDDPSKVSIMSPGDELPENALDQFKSMLNAPENTGSQLKVSTKYFYTACFVFYTYSSFIDADDERCQQIAADIANGTVDNSLNLIPPNETEIISSDKLNKFYDCIFVMNNISETTRFVMNMCYNEVAKNNVSLNNILKTLDDINISAKLYDYQIQAKNTLEKNSAEKLKNIMQIKTLSEFKQALEKDDSSINIRQYTDKLLSKNVDASGQMKDSDEDQTNDAVKVTNKVARRRLKLFKDVLVTPGSQPAEVISNDKWIIALTYSKQQNGIWGRYKPKVDSNGNILSACNLRDNEGITPQNKQIRDSSSYRWVRDGIGADDNNQESDWCTTGGAGRTDTRGGGPWGKNTSSYWPNYNNNGKYPYAQIMELDTGMMYQLGYDGSRYTGFLFESEYKSNVGLIRGTYGDTNANLTNARKANPKFDQLMKRVDEVFNRKGINVESVMTSYKKRGLVTKNGRLIVDSRGVLLECLPFIKVFTGIVVDLVNADSLFENLDCTNGLPPIDMMKVKTAVRMFAECKCESIQLLNTGNVRNAAGMFQNAKVSNISGLDTSKCEDMSLIFCNTVNYKNPAFYNSVNALDVSNCKKLNSAFYGSNFRKIALQNTDNVKEAANLYNGCIMLLNFPTVEFKSLENLKMLGATSDINYPEDMQFVFNGCTQLQKSAEFDQQVKKLYDFYIKDNKKTFTSEAEVDERGFIKIKSADDVERYCNDFNKYPGVVLDGIVDATYLLSGRNISIKTLDLGKAKDISYLFANSNINMLNEVIDSQNTVTKADCMFKNVKFLGTSRTQYPALTFKNITSSAVFADAPAPRKLSDLTLSYKIPDLPDAVNLDDYKIDEFGRRVFKNVYSTWANVFGTSMMREFVKSILKNTYANLQLDANQTKTNENGYLIVDSKAMWKLLLNVHSNDLKNWLDSLPGIYLDTDNATGFFENSKEINFPNIDMQNVTTADYMFYSCQNISLKKLENCGNITTADNMFYGSTVTNFPEDADFSGVENGYAMFSDTMISHTDTINQNEDRDEFEVTDFSSLKNATSMFNGFEGLVLNIDRMTFDNIEIAEKMFMNAKVKMTRLVLPRITSGSNMFNAATCYSAKISKISCPALTNGYHMFYNFKNQTTTMHLNAVIMPQLTSAEYMFARSNFDRIATVSMPILRNARYMFYMCQELKLILRPKFENGNMATYYMFKGSPLMSIFKMHGQRLIAKIRARNRIQ